MAGLTRAQVRNLLAIQGFSPPEPDLTEVVYRINALIEGLMMLEDLDVFQVEPWTNLPYRGLPERRLSDPPAPKPAAPHTDNVAFMTIAEQAALIESKKLSPVELVRLYLERIDRYDNRLFAFNLVMREEALAAAKQAEDEIAAGKYRGPLHGIPIGLKDQFDIKGQPNTGGCDAYIDNTAAEDCTIVARLREAGAVIIGTLATHEFHMGGTLEFLRKETPRNPWDLSRTPAGSSAGSGSSVAAGLLSGSIGGDTGGSIRGPGSVNGIAGLRPSWSRLSRQGAFALSWELDTAGPLARSAEDTAIMLQAIAGYDPKERTTSREPVPDYAAALTGKISDLKIGVFSELMDQIEDEDSRVLIENAIDVLRGMGASVETVSIPLATKMTGVQSAISDGYAASYHRAVLRQKYDLYDTNTRIRIMTGMIIPTGLQTLARRAKAALGEAVLDAFEDFDVLVGATGSGPAGPIVTQSPVKDLKTARVAISARGGASGALSNAGAAAISIPAGFTSKGLPVGWQIATRPMDEATLFRVCHAYQLVTDHHQKHPPMDWA